MDEQLENLNNESGEQEGGQDSKNDLIEAIKEVKKNTVPRKQYEELQKENKGLLDALINGGQVTQVVEEKKDIETMRKELFSKEAVEKGMTNLEFVERSLELRDAIIESGGIDPFLPVGKGIEITRDDVESAELVAEQFKECIEFAKGDSEVFTNELMRRTIDISLPSAKKNKGYYRR